MATKSKTTKLTTKQGTKRTARKRTARRRRNVIIASICAGVLLFAAAGALFSRDYLARYHGEATVIHITSDATDEAVTDSLTAGLGDEMATHVLRILGDSKPGAYRIDDGMTAWRIARNISHGYQTPVRVTLNNITDMDRLAARISRDMEFGADDFMDAVDTMLIGKGYTADNVGVAFMPDTYEFYWDAPADKVIEKLADHTRRFWTDERRKKADALSLTPTEVSILASIVEEESNQRDEYGKIARLYLNRLDRGMKLQADPTVKRAANDRTIRRVTAEHLRINSPYNTYMYHGLPPGPLHIPEGRTIDAVLDAPEHDYIYMCASPDFSGHHIFTADYAEHKANARRYQQALDARNIK